MASKTKAELETENKELKAKIKELQEVSQAVAVVEEISVVGLLAKASEKAESPRVRHLIQRAIAKV